MMVILLIYAALLPIIYRWGLKDGLAIKAGGQPKPVSVPNPVQKVKDSKEKTAQAKEQRLIEEAWNNAMAYTGEPQPGWEEES